LSIPKPIEIVIGNTGIVANTKAVVAGVRERKEAYPQKYSKIFDLAKKLVYKAREALESYDLRAVGKYMDDNHKLLQEIEVSCKELDYLIKLAKEAGALGAKLTGGGKGGCIVALTPGKKLQKNVEETLEREGFKTIKTKIK
jgi:mevalonate kinase